MSSLVTDDNKRKRSGSDDSDKWSTQANVDTSEHRFSNFDVYAPIDKYSLYWKELWKFATKEEREIMWQIVLRGMTPKEKSNYRGLGEPKSHWKLLWKNASKFEKYDLISIWDRTPISKWNKNNSGKTTQQQAIEKGLRY